MRTAIQTIFLLQAQASKKLEDSDIESLFKQMLSYTEGGEPEEELTPEQAAQKVRAIAARA